MCNVKLDTHTDEPTILHHTLKFPSALQSILASFSSLLRLCDLQLTTLIRLVHQKALINQVYTTK